MAVPGANKRLASLASNLLSCQESLDDDDFADLPVHKRMRPDDSFAPAASSGCVIATKPVLESCDFECSICQDILIDPVVGERNAWTVQCHLGGNFPAKSVANPGTCFSICALPITALSEFWRRF